MIERKIFGGASGKQVEEVEQVVRPRRDGVTEWRGLTSSDLVSASGEAGEFV